jgi:hypothetical protein
VKQAVAQVRSRPYLIWLLVGVVVWAGLAAGAAAQARARGMAVWPAVVTWDEWLVAVAVIPRMILFVLGILQPDDVAARWGKRPVVWINMAAVAALVVFALDLAVRALFGLGWKPF